MEQASLVWFRRDLRLSDNPALNAALQSGRPVMAVFIHETDPTLRPIGGASRWWLHHSLTSLDADLAAIGIPLHVATGASAALLPALARQHNAANVFWNRRYGPAERDLDAAIKAGLRAEGIAVQSSNASLLAEPWTIATGQGRPYSVFTPFWRNLKDSAIEAPHTMAASGRPAIPAASPDSAYAEPAWATKLGRHWRVGEAAAQQKLADFLDGDLDFYAEGRDFPALETTSLLSPHLAFGEIGPRQIWAAATMRKHSDISATQAVDKFLSEVAWREFNYHQLYYREDIARVPMQTKYAGMDWRHDSDALLRWQRGLTGIPIVDAGMRELWETGFMQNRVRMLVASLLTKNLLIDWRVGEHWFWDTLVDADPASNPGNWQWVAGSGLDASPYFRIFNPVTQGKRFDAAGDYVRRWVPELAAVPDAFIHEPAKAPSGLAGFYPQPIADLSLTRQRALDAAASL